MDIPELVSYIKFHGCRVTRYKKKKTIGGAIGLFYEDPPHIKIATYGRTKKEIASVLLHEYGHFCQWRDNFSQYFDGICQAHALHEEWLAKKIELSELELSMVRATMLSIEYDAEMRSAKLGQKLGVKDFDITHHLRDANSYMAAIKYSFATRTNWNQRPNNKYFPARYLTFKELFAPLTPAENKIFKRFSR